MNRYQVNIPAPYRENGKQAEALTRQEELSEKFNPT
jgi:hypothetical protein